MAKALSEIPFDKIYTGMKVRREIMGTEITGVVIFKQDDEVVINWDRELCLSPQLAVIKLQFYSWPYKTNCQSLKQIYYVEV